jgi:hypothetical protein
MNFKPLIFTLIFVASAFSCKKSTKPIACLPTDLLSGLVAFYSFSNGSLNESVNGLDLINPTSAIPSTDRSGNLKCAFEFRNQPARDEYLVCENSTFPYDRSVFSISLWYQPLDTTFVFRDYEALISRDTSPLTCPDKFGQWSLGLYDCRRPVFAYHSKSLWDTQPNTTMTGIDKCREIFNVYTNEWHHLVVTKNYGVMKLYRNGVATTLKEGDCGVGVSQNIGKLFLGKFFTGKLDDIALFNREISQDEVTQLFNLEGCCE